MKPRYPVYVISKGRADACLTADFLVRDGVPFTLVVEPQERDAYAAKYGASAGCAIVTTPFSNLGQGSIPARNFVWEHAWEGGTGTARHWILDDNIKRMRRTFRGKRLPCESGPALAAVEDFTDRYDNIAIAGMNYWFFVRSGSPPPFVANCHVYSTLLIRNDIPQRWRGRYNEDTDLCLQVLAAGMCTVLVNAFTIEKQLTMKMKGGNSDELYQGDGRLKMARSLERAWPGVVQVKRRFKRPQHVVNWQKFDTPLALRPGVDLAAIAPDEYGLRLMQTDDDLADESLLAMIDGTDVAPVRQERGDSDSRVTSDFVDRLAGCGVAADDVQNIVKIARVTKKYLSGNQGVRDLMGGQQALENRWYAALAAGGEPDWSVYEDDWYTAEVLACYFVYSRKYVRAIEDVKCLHDKTATIKDDLGVVACVADLGCGLGYTTADLAVMYPEADVVGTNIKDTLQWSFATSLGQDGRFRVVADLDDVGSAVDLVLASEYFEHIREPVAHLCDVVAKLKPRAMLVANSFGTRAIGHFETYTVDGEVVDGKTASKKFNAAMRALGYEKVKTSLWNNRPAYWKRST